MAKQDPTPIEIDGKQYWSNSFIFDDDVTQEKFNNPSVYCFVKKKDGTYTARKNVTNFDDVKTLLLPSDSWFIYKSGQPDEQRFLKNVIGLNLKEISGNSDSKFRSFTIDDSDNTSGIIDMVSPDWMDIENSQKYVGIPGYVADSKQIHGLSSSKEVYGTNSFNSFDYNQALKFGDFSSKSPTNFNFISSEPTFLLDTFNDKTESSTTTSYRLVIDKTNASYNTYEVYEEWASGEFSIGRKVCRKNSPLVLCYRKPFMDYNIDPQDRWYDWQVNTEECTYGKLYSGCGFVTLKDRSAGDISGQRVANEGSVTILPHKNVSISMKATGNTDDIKFVRVDNRCKEGESKSIDLEWNKDWTSDLSTVSNMPYCIKTEMKDKTFSFSTSSKLTGTYSSGSTSLEVPRHTIWMKFGVKIPTIYTDTQTEGLRERSRKGKSLFSVAEDVANPSGYGTETVYIKEKYAVNCIPGTFKQWFFPIVRRKSFEIMKMSDCCSDNHPPYRVQWKNTTENVSSKWENNMETFSSHFPCKYLLAINHAFSLQMDVGLYVNMDPDGGRCGEQTVPAIAIYCFDQIE